MFCCNPHRRQNHRQEPSHTVTDRQQPPLFSLTTSSTGHRSCQAPRRMRLGGATGAPPASRSRQHGRPRPAAPPARDADATAPPGHAVRYNPHDRRSPLHPQCFAMWIPGACGSRMDNSTSTPLPRPRYVPAIPTSFSIRLRPAAGPRQLSACMGCWASSARSTQGRASGESPIAAG